MRDFVRGISNMLGDLIKVRPTNKGHDLRALQAEAELSKLRQSNSNCLREVTQSLSIASARNAKIISQMVDK